MDLVSNLYFQLLDTWNQRNASEMSAVFTQDGEIIGFDGSQVQGQTEIETHLQEIFSHHITPRYVGKVKDIRLIAPEVVILRAIAGMVPNGEAKIDPKLNTLHTIVAVKQKEDWRICLYQNTPAQFHGRPELVQQQTMELEQLL